MAKLLPNIHKALGSTAHVAKERRKDEKKRGRRKGGLQAGRVRAKEGRREKGEEG